ncbi:restriction endonuclease subunit S [Bacillus sp. FJAT-26377]|nr:restriction endonuclease subunit S [Bacillus sp. FJAT-26377]
MSTNKYTNYVESEVSWLREYPANWKLQKLKYLCDINTGSKDTQDKTDDGMYPFFVRSPIVEKLNEYTHDDEAIMTAGDGVGVGKVFHYYQGKFSAHQRVYVFTKFKNTVGKFLFYYLKSNLAFEVLSGNAKSTVDSLRRPMLSEFLVVVPSLDEQIAIVNFLDWKLSKIDSLINSKEELIKLLEEKRQSLITEAVTKGLNPNVKMKDSGVEWIGKVPEHWQIKKFKRCFKIFNGKEITNELDIEDENGIDVFGSGGKFKKTDEFIYDGKSVLFGRKGTIGKPLYVNRKFWTVDTMYFTKFHKESYPKWFYYVLKVYPWHLIMTQTALPSIVGSDIENDYWCIPPYKEQQEITSHLDQLNDKTDNLILNINKQISNLKAYSESLIYEAVTGKIDIREFETVQ